MLPRRIHNVLVEFDPENNQFVPSALDADFLYVPEDTRWPLYQGRYLLRIVHVLEKGLMAQDMSSVPLSDEGMAARMNHAVAEEIARSIRHTLMQYVELSDEEMKILNDADQPMDGLPPS